MKIIKIILLSLCLNSSVYAKDKPIKPYTPKVKVFNFALDEIRGDIKLLDGSYIEARRLSKQKSLIKLRQHWKKKIRQSVEEL